MEVSRYRGAFQLDMDRGRDRLGCDRRSSGPGRSRGSGEPVQEVGAEQARVPRPAVRVEDLEIRLPAGGAIAVAGHLHGAPLADDVPAQADPARPAQVEAQATRLLHGRGERAAEGDGLHQDEQGPRSPGERRQPSQPVTHTLAGHSRITPVRQVHHEQVHRPGGEQRTGERQRLLDVHRCQDHEPLRPDAPSHRLHRVEGPGEVKPGHDRPASLGLRGDAEGDGRLARRGVPS